MTTGITINETPIVLTVGAVQGPPGPKGDPGPTGPAGAAQHVTNVASFQATSFDVGTKAVNIQGYSTIGLGGFNVRRVNSQPSHPWKFRSTDLFKADGSTDDTNGGWWEGYPDTDRVVSVLQFGAAVDGVTDDYTAITNALAYARSQCKNQPLGYGWTGTDITVRLGNGVSYVSQTICLTSDCLIEGTSITPSEAAGPSILQFPKNTIGISNQSPANGQDTLAGTNARLRNFIIRSPAYDPTTDPIGSYHGLKVRWLVIAENLVIKGFNGDGINCVGNTGQPPMGELYGAVNGAIFRNIHVDTCTGNGIYIAGGDANICKIEQISSSNCGGYGIYDHALLGNAHEGHQAVGCGRQGNTMNRTTWVVDGGNIYTPIPDDSETHVAACQTKQPSTNLTDWALVGAGSADGNIVNFGEVYYGSPVHRYTVIPGQEANMWTTAPQVGGNAVWTDQGAASKLGLYWHNGMSPYCLGGSYASFMPGNKGTWVNCYSEDGTPGIYNTSGFFLNGTNARAAANPVTPGGIIETYQGDFFVEPGGINFIHSDGGGNDVTTRIGDANKGINILTLKRSFQFASVGAKDVVFQYGTTSGYDTHQYCAPDTTHQFGRGASCGPSVLAYQLFTYFIGAPNSSGYDDARQLGYAAGAPTGGSYPRNLNFGVGDMVINNARTNFYTPFAWQCSVSGKPGTWDALYMSPVPNIGVMAYGSLPAANSVPNGTTAIITDCNSTTLGGTAAAGGANRVRVNSDGTNWKIG